MMYPVRKGVPIPKSKGWQGVVPDSLSGQMRALEIGECLFVSDKPRSVVAALASVLKKRHGLQFTTRRTVDEDGVPCIGVWRIDVPSESASNEP